MVAIDTTFTTSFSPDGTASIEHAESVPDGETWYLDNIVVYSDGGHGSDATTTVDFGAYDDDISIGSGDVDRISNGHASGTINPEDSAKIAEASTLGVYLSDLETFYIADSGDATSDATYHVVVHARRVL